MNITDHIAPTSDLPSAAPVANPGLVGYCRAAIDDPLKIEKQRETMVAHCAMHCGAVPTIFIDAAVSGMVADRPGLSALIEHCMRNPGCKVVVIDAAHLARNLHTFREVQERIYAAGATLEIGLTANRMRERDRELMLDRADFGAVSVAARLRKWRGVS